MKDEENFTSGSIEDLNKTKFLINVNIENVMINDQKMKICFINDVSFGILYEQK